MTDDELRTVLRTWEAPRAPDTLRQRVFRERQSVLRWLLGGNIRVPVPIALAVLGLLIFAVFRAAKPPTASLSDFEQVQQFRPRIVRTSDATR